MTEQDRSDPDGDQTFAELSRPESKWKNLRNGKRGGTKQVRHTRVNWYHAFLWPHIDKAARKLFWSPSSIANRLQLDHPKLFRNINKGTISKWIDKTSKRDWSETTKSNVKRYHALAGSGRIGILGKCPEVANEIVEQLRGLRKAGLLVNATIARSVMLAIIEKRKPEILKDFKCSDVSDCAVLISKLTNLCQQRFVRAFVQSKLNWTPRKGTRAAAHLPADAEDQCEATFFRIVYAMKWENIPPKALSFLFLSCFPC